MARQDYSQVSFAEVRLEVARRERKRLKRLDEASDLLDWTPIDPILVPVNGGEHGDKATRLCACLEPDRKVDERYQWFVIQRL